MEVQLEAGTPEGHELKYELEADEFPDKLPGDVKFAVETAPHKTFKRDGNNLHMTVKISLLEALVGFEKVFKHMDDHDFVVKRERPTPHGFVITLPDEVCVWASTRTHLHTHTHTHAHAHRVCPSTTCRAKGAISSSPSRSPSPPS